MRRFLFILMLLTIMAAVSLTGWRLFKRVRQVNEKIINEEGVYRLGEITVCPQSAEIRFKGKVFKGEGRVQHLIYLAGYKWLSEESAIISQAELVDLQKAIALLDWRLWDALWHKEKFSEDGGKTPAGLSLSIKWGRQELFARSLVLADDELQIGDFLFLGSPYFDHIALLPASYADCRVCPIFALEEKALRQMFVRESGYSGYELNPEMMPAKGSEVDIIIRLVK